jgi:hypothetical protein
LTDVPEVRTASSLIALMMEAFASNDYEGYLGKKVEGQGHAWPASRYCSEFVRRDFVKPRRSLGYKVADESETGILCLMHFIHKSGRFLDNYTEGILMLCHFTTGKLMKFFYGGSCSSATPFLSYLQESNKS